MTDGIGPRFRQGRRPRESEDGRKIDVLGSKMHYIERGEGNPILFLHGIPTSNEVWRNVIPYLARLGRCIAPDLIGFGQSDRPDITYSVFDHIRYLEAFIDALNLKKITLVMHGWGSVIGFDYAMRHEKNCAGLVFYEAFLHTEKGYDLSLPFQEQLFELQHSTEDGISLINKMISQSVMHALTDDEIALYREPFMQGDVQPILQYLKEVPTGQQTKVDKLIEHYSQKLTQSTLPKLMLYSVPGFMTTIETAIWAKEHLPHLEIIDIGEELHLAQESCPDMMGETISAWLQGVEQGR